MATVVFLHAHPDDESITTGGTIAKLAAAGHRTVLVVATDGRHGEVPADLAEGESLADRRRRETEQSAALLGVDRLAWLGYHDSGMTGWEQNGVEDSFHQADLDDAAAHLADLLRAEAADVLVTYDWHGGYGHPDHIKVHHVGHRAAKLAATPELYEATMNSDAVARFMAAARASGAEIEFDPNDTDDGIPFGTPEALLTTAVDVRGFIDVKRASMASHRSQITDTSFFLTMPDEVFAESFGTEWFVHVGAPAGIHESSLAGLS